MDALISIILPTYNGTRYIDQSVASCVRQSFTHWELIIVDDGSCAAAAERISRCAERDHRVRIVRHLRNLGLPCALNSGFRQSIGRYLTWTSDDNLYRPRALETMVGFLEEHPAVDMVYSDFTRIDEHGRPFAPFRVGDPQTLVFGNFMSACFLYRRTVYEAVGDYDESMFTAEDYDYWMRVAAGHRMAALHQDLYLYRHHPRSLGSTRARQILSATESCLKRNLPNLRWVSASYRAQGYLRLARMARMRGDTHAARAYLWSGARASAWDLLRHAAPDLLLWAMGGARLAAAGRRLRLKRSVPFKANSG
jgi:glycosyltransferase involved in cell wall biosynthesis